LTENDQFIVLGCDGIWDCKSNQQVVDFIRKGLCEFKSLGTICEELMDSCLATKPNFSGIGCDNMTIMIVAFLNQRTVQEWYDWMGSSKRV
jgi:protein phosphatase 2C family protein 2/3